MSDRPIISRKEAVELGLKRYFTGKPCKVGHLAEFYVSSCQCYQCTADRNAEFRRSNPGHFAQYYASNVEYHRKRVADYRAANREKLNQKGIERRVSDPAKARDISRRYYLSHAEARRSNTKDWRRKNPLAVRVYVQRRRARIVGAEGRHSASDIVKILRLQKHRCANCRKSIRFEWHVDHITPLSKGGTNWPRNLQCLCETCNLKKHAKDPIVFAQEQGRLL